MSKKRLAILTTHPIQYQAPWFRALAKHPDLELQVYFCHQSTPEDQAAAGFGVNFDWDTPLLDGYEYYFLKNIAKNPSTRRFDGLDTPEIKNIIAQERYDAVLLTGWHFKSAWQAMRACWHVRTPVMIRGDSHLHTPRHPLKKLLKWPFYRWFISKFDAYLAVGVWSEEYYRHYGAKGERIFFVPHSVADYFGAESARLRPERQLIRRRWQLSDDAIVFLFAGKFTPTKRPMDFVQAVMHASGADERIAGLMVGNGALHEQCESYVRQNNLPIHFTGFLNQSQIVNAYVAADALVLPSSEETWGMVVNEAMSCGLPCIVSDQVGCSPDLVHPGETGATFSVGDISALSKLLVEVAADEAFLRSSGDRVQLAVKIYSIEAAVSGVIQALNAVSTS